MSTAPSGWQSPKTNWVPPDVPLPSDFNRIEGNINAIETGDRTLDQAQAPTGNQGSLRQILSWFANRIKAITGSTNWWDAPAATIATIWGKFNGSSGHKHTGGANDAPPIPLNGIDSDAKTTAGGSEANRLAVTDANGGVGRANALKDANGEYRTATGPGGWGIGAAYRVPITDANGRVGDSQRLGGVDASNYVRTDQRPVFTAGIQDGDSNADVSLRMALELPIDTRTWEATAWNTAGKPTHYDLKDGQTVIATADITYNSLNKPTQVIVVGGGKTIIYIITWIGNKHVKTEKVVT